MHAKNKKLFGEQGGQLFGNFQGASKVFTVVLKLFFFIQKTKMTAY
jgi:hypothetical protein